MSREEGAGESHRCPGSKTFTAVGTRWAKSGLTFQNSVHFPSELISFFSSFFFYQKQAQNRTVKQSPATLLALNFYIIPIKTQNPAATETRVSSGNTEPPSIGENEGHARCTAPVTCTAHVCRCAENLIVELLLFYCHKQTRPRVPIALSVFCLFPSLVISIATKMLNCHVITTPGKWYERKMRSRSFSLIRILSIAVSRVWNVSRRWD